MNVKTRFVIYFLFSIVVANAMDKFECEKKISTNPLKPIVRKNEYNVYAIDHPTIRLEAELWNDGGLEVTIIAKSLDGKNTRSKTFFAKDQFKYMMQYFKGEVKYIIGFWQSEILIDNLILFENAYKLGKSIEEAALETWTGKQAKKFGYGKVKVISIEEFEVKTDKIFKKVYVQFHKG
ncbi:MAG: hypothetical protein H6622_09795 [Halobacteriovoraceae bacterium]|nr:hypothetical protein [Halobacteriovoraceae bacterium]